LASDFTHFTQLGEVARLLDCLPPQHKAEID
jgi:hypothetical protein